MKNLASNLSILEKFMTESGNIFPWGAVLGEFIQSRSKVVS